MLDEPTRQHYLALTDWLAERTGQTHCPVIGINGAQGSGKSTLAQFLVDALEQAHGLRAAVLSIDDCYYGHARRQALAQTIHRLLATRGVPGTHDVDLGQQLIESLKHLEDDASLAMPRFSKARDDRLPESEWPQVEGPFHLILFEGWCVGIPPQTEADLVEPVNLLERSADAAGRWRQYVNDQLAGPYAKWFAMLDALVFLQIPRFEQVAVWRGQQEAETAQQADRAGPGLMTTSQLARFIQHYERLTRHALSVLPAVADVCLQLDESHAVVTSEYR